MWPSKSGTYALTLQVGRPRRLTVGKLGRIRILPGYYVYVGSAFGPGGLKARLSHHAEIAPAPHWHIDYLRPHTETAEIWYTTDRHRREHDWAAMLAKHRHASMPAPGFGATDCRCGTHLFHFDNKPSSGYFCRNIHRRLPEHGPIHIRVPGK